MSNIIVTTAFVMSFFLPLLAVVLIVPNVDSHWKLLATCGGVFVAVTANVFMSVWFATIHNLQAGWVFIGVGWFMMALVTAHVADELR